MRSVVMNLSNTIFYPITLNPSVVPIAAKNPIIICKNASAERLAVDKRCPIEVIRQYSSTRAVEQQKLGQSIMHATKPINFNVKVKYLYFSSSAFSNSYSQHNFFIGRANKYPNKNIVMVPPAVIVFVPKCLYLYQVD